MKEDQQALSNVKATPFGPTVVLPNSTDIQATHSGQLPFHPSLSDKAKRAHVLDGITNSSLVSLGQLCDDDCIAILDKQKLEVFKNDACILTGPRNTTDGLWDIPIPIEDPTTHQEPQPWQQVNAIIRKDQTKQSLPNTFMVVSVVLYNQLGKKQ